MNYLGVYFGPKVIGIVETKGRKIINDISIPQSKIAELDLEEKVPEELKITTSFDDEFKKNRVSAKNATVVVSGKDLIIRTFEMPVLPPEELRNAVSFEVKKYIPFKVEDLISDFQIQADKINKKNLILFVGIKKEALEKYLAILSQLEIAVNSIECSAFTALRLLKLARVKEQGIVAVVNIDLIEEDEINFLVLKDGFPLFSRDIILAAESVLPQEYGAKKPDLGTLLEKFKAELRISLDFYHRKFPAQNIESIFFITAEDYRQDLEAFIKEKDLSAQFLELKIYTGKTMPFSLSIFKAYSGSLSWIIKTGLKIDLLAAKGKSKLAFRPARFPLLNLIKINPVIATLGILICLGTFLFGFYRRMPLEKELKVMTGLNKPGSYGADGLSYDSLVSLDAKFRQKMEAVNNLVKRQLYATEMLDALIRILPKGIWLTELNFNQTDNILELTLNGMAYLEGVDKESRVVGELELVNSFTSGLKENPFFNKNFKDITVLSTENSFIGKETVTKFIITLKGAR